MKMKTTQSPPLIIPIFITHEGCPHRCIFCNQEPITGQNHHVGPQEVEDEIRKWLRRSPARGRRVETAFYGGSFTALPIIRQRELLRAVQPFLESGKVQAIRLSTRPDYIDSKSADFLSAYGVQTVELGIQSMSDKVLAVSQRGHTVEQSIKAINFLSNSGLQVGVQLLLGLPAETTRSTLQGTRQLTTMRIDFVRLYPALVIKGSGLADLYHRHKYRPLTMNQTIALTARIASMLSNHHIPVIRIGLPASKELEKNLLAGPYHPALGEMVAARIFFNKIRKRLTSPPGNPWLLTISQRDRSIFYGQKKCSLQRLERLGLLNGGKIKFSDNRRGLITLKADSEQACT